MDEKSSNKVDMDRELEILSKVQRVEPGDHLFEQIMEKIEARSGQNFLWLKMAAAIAALMLIANVYIIMTHDTEQLGGESIELVPNPSNQLYHE